MRDESIVEVKSDIVETAGNIEDESMIETMEELFPSTTILLNSIRAVLYQSLTYISLNVYPLSL